MQVTPEFLRLKLGRKEYREPRDHGRQAPGPVSGAQSIQEMLSRSNIRVEMERIASSQPDQSGGQEDSWDREKADDRAEVGTKNI